MSVRPQTGEGRVKAASESPYRFGKYTLLAKLAQGGMGEVFAALLSGAAGFEKLVVIKRILPHLAEDPRFVSMFLTEAKLTASLSHPNICQVFELGEIGGEFYLAMEYLEGVSLSRLVKQRVHRGVDVRAAGGIVCQVLEGLQFAHRFRAPGGGLVGVIHRDMSPSNVFLTSAGQVKVLDFGVAKVSHHAKTTVTGLKGKYPYMAPEQIRGQELDGRSDLFSVGVVLFEAVTGEPLFHRDNDFDTLQAIVNNDRPRVSDFRSDVPLGLEEVIERALRPRREERFASAREMSEAITRALAPVGGPAATGELCDVIRRECGGDLDQERARVDKATEYLKELNQRGVDAPDFGRRRARPIMDGDKQAHIEGHLHTEVPTTSEGLVRPPTSVATTGGDRRRWAWIVAAFLTTGLVAVSVGLMLASRKNQPSDRAAAVDSPAASPAVTDASVAALGPSDAQVTPPDAAAAAATAVADAAPTDDGPPDQADKATGQAGKDARGGRGTARPPRGNRSGNSGGKGVKAVATAPGYFSIDSMPYSKVFIDGKYHGITPLIKVPLRAGRHNVRLEAEAGKSKRFTVSLQPGKTLSRRVKIDN